MKILLVTLLVVIAARGNNGAEDPYKDKRASGKSPSANSVATSSQDKQQQQVVYSSGYQGQQQTGHFGVPQPHNGFVPVQYVQPRYVIPQQVPQTAMLIIPQHVPQYSFAGAASPITTGPQPSSHFAQAAQQLIQYYQSNPQARLQLLQGYQNAGHQIPTIPASALQYGHLQLSSAPVNQLAGGNPTTLQQLHGAAPLQLSHYNTGGQVYSQGTTSGQVYTQGTTGGQVYSHQGQGTGAIDTLNTNEYLPAPPPPQPNAGDKVASGSYLTPYVIRSPYKG